MCVRVCTCVCTYVRARACVCVWCVCGVRFTGYSHQSSSLPERKETHKSLSVLTTLYVKAA